MVNNNILIFMLLFRMASSTFTTFNQFDKRFATFEKFGSDRSACPLFGLITCYNFMTNGNTDQKQHETNVYSAVTNYMTNTVPKYMLFEELLVLTSGTLKPNDIGATTPELIVTGVMGYDNIFKLGYNQNYCVLFLKNRNYIAILCKYNPDNTTTYAVRDCHENTQRNFNIFDTLKTYLDTTYQFEQETIVAGVPIPEFGNIEYLVIDTPFNLDTVDTDLIDDTIEEEKNYKEEKIEVPTEKYEDDYAFALSLQLQMEDEDEEFGKEYVSYIS